MNWRLCLSFLTTAICIAGCEPEEVKTQQTATEPEVSAPAIESISEKTELLGLEAVRITSNVDHFSITLPNEFRGTVLTADEISKFGATLSKASPQLGAQVAAQCNQLRPSGGALFALNVVPSSVVDGFADNMNVTIRGSKESPNFESAKRAAMEELKRTSPKSTVSSTDLSFRSGKMVEIKIVGMEGPPTGKIQVSRFLYLTVNGQRIWTATYACATKREPVVAKQFRASALSLQID